MAKKESGLKLLIYEQIERLLQDQFIQQTKTSEKLTEQISLMNVTAFNSSSEKNS